MEANFVAVVELGGELVVFLIIILIISGSVAKDGLNDSIVEKHLVPK